MKKPKEKIKKIHSLRHQITAYFIGLLFLSILTITVINGAFLEKYYVTKKDRCTSGSPNNSGKYRY